MDQKADTTDRFQPRFDPAGLVTAIVTDAATGTLLMVAHMNCEAIRLTQETGQAHFWSRSRQAMWRKGETSGDRLGAGLMRALAARVPDTTFVGVGGPAMSAAGLTSLFPMSDLAVMGIGPVLARLPLLIRRIRETAAAAITAWMIVRVRAIPPPPGAAISCADDRRHPSRPARRAQCRGRARGRSRCG